MEFRFKLVCVIGVAPSITTDEEPQLISTPIIGSLGSHVYFVKSFLGRTNGRTGGDVDKLSRQETLLNITEYM